MHAYELTRIIQQSILEGGKPAKVVSAEIGKPYSTMLREANPYDTTAKVGVETLMDIMKATGNLTPLRFMAARFGYELVRKTETVSDDLFSTSESGRSINA